MNGFALDQQIGVSKFCFQSALISVPRVININFNINININININ